jgi:hypothetical protein
MKTSTFFIFCLFSLVSLISNSCKKDSDPRYVFNKESLLANYPFDGNANDISDNSFDGIVHGAVLTMGRNNVKNGAYLFNGFNNYIELPSKMVLNSDSSFSIEAWIKNDSITADEKYTDNAIFGQSDGYFGSDYPLILLEIKNDNTVRGAFRGTSDPALDIRSEVSIENGVWNHIVMVRNANENNLKIYINGSLAANKELQLDSNTSSNKSISIGGYVDDLQSVYHFFCGSIDQVRIWNIALSQTEIIDLKNDNFEIE